MIASLRPSTRKASSCRLGLPVKASPPPQCRHLCDWCQVNLRGPPQISHVKGKPTVYIAPSRPPYTAHRVRRVRWRLNFHFNLAARKRCCCRMLFIMDLERNQSTSSRRSRRASQVENDANVLAQLGHTQVRWSMLTPLLVACPRPCSFLVKCFC